MSSIRIHYNKVVIPFPQNSELEVSELTALFKVKELGIHIKFLQNGTWHNQCLDSFSQKFIVAAEVRDVYLVGIPEEDPKYENSNMNIVPQSPPVESLEFLSGGPTAAGAATLMSSPLILTTPWYAAASVHPSTGYNNIVHQTAGQIANSNTPSSVLNMSVIGGDNTGKRGNAASNNMALFKNTINKLGPKAVPPKRQKRYNEYSSSTCSNSRKPSKILKTITISEVNKGDQLQTVLETKIDLGKLNRLYGDFTVKHIQEEVCYQIGHEGVLVMTYKNGNTVKDSPNTRGLENWNDKTMIRAIAADEESELFGGIMDEEFDNLVLKDFQKGFKNLETSGKNIFLSELKEQQNLETVKDLFCAELNEIKKEIKNIKKEEKESCRQNLLNLFKCIVCFESAPNSYMSCPFCGRYLGCYKCISELNRCPICRRKFQCTVCHYNFPKSPLFIPGIGEYLSLPEVRRQTIDKGNESDGSLSQARTIPATDNLPDVALPGPDGTP